MTPTPKILFEDDQLIAVNKPSGILTVPDRFDPKLPSLKLWLKERLGSIFVVHRIDRDTSGIILFAKTAEAHAYYSQLFEDRKITKKYVGLVMGNPMPTSGTINKPIAHHPVVKGKMVVYKGGKPSITHYQTFDQFGLYSLVEFSIETGRTHQIRVHMQDLGHPLVGDPLYGNGEAIFLSKIKRKFKLSKYQEEELPLLNRLALHASSLAFTTPEGKEIYLEAEWFKDMQATITQLRKNSR
jgi:23S rRNA pseudouridine955/2504/2580 synthase/23S rRNA pseudouridine1911/1915/1917 synthase